MSASFTPAPWYVFDDDSYMVGAYPGEVATIIADTDPIGQRTPQSDEECIANARLIAAAPELYEAVLLFVEEYDAANQDEGVAMMLAYNAALEAGKAALAKARGEQ